ncbi:dehydrogenase [Longilinea arvoryzae]|uniref:Dehydrogenase n=1 Tax=Longilinea arvoryzae TaxID=360412 RepID=A0A0S7BF19_9CHLR|nr:SDR family oxidoreductase [Longilinea arvoryzae]GAP13584.1 dehydrogenase [Longilinea arvoryzae]
MVEFAAKVAIVTGAASGIGRTSALFYAREGANVVVSDIDEEGGRKTVRLIREKSGEAFFIKTDVANPADCEALVRRTIENYGRLDIACNNAGIGGEQGQTADYSIEGWQKVIGVNLSGVFYCMKYEIAEMLKVGGGVIVNMASILGQVGFAGAPAYVAAKHGVIGLTRTAALEYAAKGIRVNAIGPAFIRTPMLTSLEENADVLNGLVALHPIGRLGRPEEVAELVIWLSSNHASFVTGAYYAVDGGYLSR